MNTETFRNVLLHMQADFCASLGSFETCAFQQDNWQRGDEEKLKGEGRTWTIENGDVIEKGCINYSHVRGDSLPDAATISRSEIAGSPFEAMGVSIVMHPKSPMVPTSHFNIRLFVAYPRDKKPIWWFGGGMDLTPYYPFDEDIIHWHQQAKKACDFLGKENYQRFKKACDNYFYLEHRKETRGVGGVFYDDLNEVNNGYPFEKCCAFQKCIGHAYTSAYSSILMKRKDIPYDDKARSFQLYRRGRYVEFNLIYDRGTLFGLQSGGRTESILGSLPNIVHWKYDWRAEENSAESRLNSYLKPQDWLENTNNY